jgi:hypothetical protein
MDRDKAVDWPEFTSIGVLVDFGSYSPANPGW